MMSAVNFSSRSAIWVTSKLIAETNREETHTTKTKLQVEDRAAHDTLPALPAVEAPPAAPAMHEKQLETTSPQTHGTVSAPKTLRHSNLAQHLTPIKQRR
jgi:hypothetical protein